MKRYTFSFDTSETMLFAPTLARAIELILAYDKCYFIAKGKLYYDFSNGKRSDVERVGLNIQDIKEGVFAANNFG